MAFFDMLLDQLEVYRPEVYEPSDFDAFWSKTLSEVRAYPLNAVFEPVDYGFRTVETFDVTFSGYAGQPIKGWFIIPSNRTTPLPCVVEYIGYGGGRGFVTDWLLWARLLRVSPSRIAPRREPEGGPATGKSRPEGRGPRLHKTALLRKSRDFGLCRNLYRSAGAEDGGAPLGRSIFLLTGEPAVPGTDAPFARPKDAGGVRLVRIPPAPRSRPSRDLD